MLPPILQHLSTQLPHPLKIPKVNLHENPQSASPFPLITIPTFIFFKHPQPLHKLVPLNSKHPLKPI
ncbi:thioredoxin domain-containing protein, partial [Paenibacillus xylanexedens]|uniref:thioredoxin domain-containing protein n=1 Tax=Paenibacillus xylanexedens TaxID=528191 RepID=UPI0034D98589